MNINSKFKIPINDLKKEYNFLAKEINRQINECFKTHLWILGPKVTQLEEAVAQYLGVKYAAGVASGTDALVLSLRALAIKLKKKEFFEKKDEIITTPLTFIATGEAILRSGATPVFVDVEEDTFNISPQKIVGAINKNTVGVIAVHLYGLPSLMDEILRIARNNNLFVIEDSAQAFGAEFKGKKVGSMGDAGAFSFFPSKNLGGYGDGGMVVTNNSKLARLIKILRNHGQRKKYDAYYLGYNSRLDSLQSAILLAKLSKIDKLNKLRREVAEKYRAQLKDIKEIKLPYQPSDRVHVYHLYTIEVSSRRDRLLNFLRSGGIDARIYYPLLLHKMNIFRDCKVGGDLKNAERISKKILTLPMHPFLNDKQLDYITSRIKKFFKYKR